MQENSQREASSTEAMRSSGMELEKSSASTSASGSGSANIVTTSGTPVVQCYTVTKKTTTTTYGDEEGDEGSVIWT